MAQATRAPRNSAGTSPTDAPRTSAAGTRMPGRRPDRSGSRPTQADVAREAGVSQATVSMALNGGPEARTRLTDDTRRRVLEAVENTGYWGNLAAQNLAGRSTSVLGVFTYEPVFPHAASDFYYPFLRGIEAEAIHHDVDLLMFTSSPPQESGREGLSSWARRGRLRLSDGCILLGRHSHRKDLAELLAHDYPYVFIGRREADGAEVPYVGADYETATHRVTEHLIRGGHRKIALALEFPDLESDVDRRRGYRQALADAGLAPIELDARNGDGRDTRTVDVASLLDDIIGTGVTAAAVGPGIAADLRLEALRRGLAIPSDLSIARLGDPEQPGGNAIDWTGFSIPRHEMGEEAVWLLLRHLQNPDDPGPIHTTLECRCSVGTTTAPVATTHQSEDETA